VTDSPTVGAAARLAEVVSARDCADALARAGAALAALTGASLTLAGVVDGEDDGVRIVRAGGLDRSRLRSVLGSPAAVATLAAWRERPVPPERVEILEADAGSDTIALAPVSTDRWSGFVALVGSGTPTPSALDALAAVARHTAGVVGRLQTEESLARQRAVTDAVVQAMPLAVVGVDPEGRIRRLNDAACALFGLSGSFDLGRPVAECLGAPRVEAMLTDPDPDAGHEIEVELGSPPGRFRVARSRVFDGATCVERVLTFQPLPDARPGLDLQGNAIAVIGHELRTPLTVVAGFAQTLAAHGGRFDDDQRREFLGAIVHQSGRLGRLIEDLLLLSAEHRDRPPALVPTHVDVARVLDLVVDDARSEYPGRPLAVRATGTMPDGDALLDRSRLEQVLAHLVDNALKFSSEAVEVELRGDATNVTVSVVDDGPGIDAGDLDRIFEPFTQVDSSSTRAHGGAGVGLYVVSLLVHQMGGTVRVESAPGQGSRFTVVLPRNRAVQPSGQVRGESPPVRACPGDADHVRTPRGR
jgi:signal transduction histidine kinase